ncbi:hypothetical protein ACVWYH_000417 [Bradyrhizobium sp. GM24.11]
MPGIEVNILQHFRDRIGRRFQAEAMAAIAAGEHQCESRCAIL